MDSLGVILIVIASFMVVLAVGAMFITQSVGRAQASGVCRGSVVLKGNTEFGKFGTSFSPLKTTCKTYDDTLEGPQLLVMKEIAERSTDCWWAFANGNYGNVLCAGEVADISKCNSVYCFPCYTFTIKNTKDFKPFSASDLRAFMSSATYIIDTTQTKEEKKPGSSVEQPQVGSEISYTDYIQYGDNGVLYFGRELGAEGEFMIEAGKTYAIYYLEPHHGHFRDSSIFQKQDKNAIYINLADSDDLGCEKRWSSQGR
jgi:hypothetical protein